MKLDAKLSSLPRITEQPTAAPSGAERVATDGAASRAVGTADALLKLNRPGRNTGVEFCTTALRDIRARTSRGERVVVIFDIDNTLVDTRHRTLAAARSYGAASGITALSAMGIEDVGLDAHATWAKTGLAPNDPRFEGFHDAWKAAFWTEQSYDLDAPIAETIGLAKRAKAAGAECVYLTGRTFKDATVAQLQRLGLPDADAARTLCKAPGQHTPSYKLEQIELLVGQGAHIAWFFTEGKRDMSHIQAHAPAVPCVLLDFIDEAGHSVHPRTPFYRLAKS